MSDVAGPATRPPVPSPRAVQPAPAVAPRAGPASTPATLATAASATAATAASGGGGIAPMGNAATVRTASPNSVSLATGTLQLPEALAAEVGGTPVRIPVHLDRYAHGELMVSRRGDGLHSRPESQLVPLIHPALERLRAAGLEPMLEVTVRDSKISGRAALGRGPGQDGLPEAIRRHAGKLGWAGIDLKKLGRPENKLENGRLRFVLHDMGFDIGPQLNGSITFGLDGEAVIFDGRAVLRVAGQQADVRVSRDAAGGLAITGDMQLTIGKATATLHAALDSAGTFDVRGTGAYRADKFSGEITVIVADRRVADALARAQLGVPQADKQPAGAEPAAARAPRDPAVVGWGTLDFAISEWLTGKAKVVIDGHGELTVIGDITPPAEVVLFEQRDYIRQLFKIEGRAVYGVPVVGNVFVFANIGMEALAKLGPGKLHSIKLSGTYSTRPDVARSFAVSGTLTISAFAGLRLRAEGGAGLEVLDHDIKVGVGVNGLAGVRGYVEATPTIGMREVGEPAARKTEFFLKGHLEMAAQPFLGLSGDLFVELDSPWWSPAPDKKWTWPIGALEYPLPGEFGIAADLEYVLGSGKLPDIKFGEVGFDSGKFITDLVNDHVPPKRAGEQQKPGKWKEGETGGEAPGKGAAVTAGGSTAGGVTAGGPARVTGEPAGKDQSGKPEPKPDKPLGGTGKSAPVGGKPSPEHHVANLERGLKEAEPFVADEALDLVALKRALDGIRSRHHLTSLEPVIDDHDPEHAEVWAKGAVNPSGKTAKKPRNLTELIAQRSPINGKYRGTVFKIRNPKSLAAKYPNGIKFDSSGFPDFSDHAIATAAITMRGNHDYGPEGDFGEANVKAKDASGNSLGFTRTERHPGYTWHHHQDRKRMLLIPTDLHDAVRHSGGVWVVKKVGMKGLTK